MPPSFATSQYPLPLRVALPPTMGPFSWIWLALPWNFASPLVSTEPLSYATQNPCPVGVGKPATAMFGNPTSARAGTDPTTTGVKHSAAATATRVPMLRRRVPHFDLSTEISFRALLRQVGLDRFDRGIVADVGRLVVGRRADRGGDDVGTTDRALADVARRVAHRLGNRVVALVLQHGRVVRRARDQILVREIDEGDRARALLIDVRRRVVLRHQAFLFRGRRVERLVGIVLALGRFE